MLKSTFPKKIQGMLASAIPFTGVCFRSVSQRFANRRDILSAKGSILVGGRFNYKGAFEMLYLSCDIHTCIEETTKSLEVSPREVAEVLPLTVMGVEVRLSQVLDLTDARRRRRLGITKRDLICPNWIHTQNVENREAFTQQIGRLTHEAGFEAILVPSTVRPRQGKNLDVFPDRLKPGSSLRVLNLEQLVVKKQRN